MYTSVVKTRRMSPPDCSPKLALRRINRLLIHRSTLKATPPGDLHSSRSVALRATRLTYRQG